MLRLPVRLFLRLTLNNGDGNSEYAFKRLQSAVQKFQSPFYTLVRRRALIIYKPMILRKVEKRMG